MNAIEYAELWVDGTTFEVRDVDGVEGVSQLFTFRVVAVATAASPSADDLVGKDARLSLRDGFGGERIITGVAADCVVDQRDDGSRALDLVVRPEEHLLTKGSHCRVFQEATVVDVVDGVLGSIRHRWELTETYPTYPYVAQYREADWNFVSRWLEREGIHYWFDHGDGSTLVLSDASPLSPPLHGGEEFRFAADDHLNAIGDSVHEIGTRCRVMPGAFALKSYNPSHPLADVAGSHGAGTLEIYDAPGGGPEAADECARQARMMGDAASAQAAEHLGQSFSARITPGMAMLIVGHPIDRLNEHLFITETHLTVRQRRRGSATELDKSVNVRYVAIERRLPYRPARITEAPTQAGLQSGVVIGTSGAEIYPDESGRVRVQHHWDRDGQRDEKSGKWMRVAQRGAASSLQLPRMGWNVMTFNDEGDVDAPSVLSRVQDAEHMPPYALPENKTRVVFKTHTSPGHGSFNEIYLEDLKGNEEMFLNASKDMTLLTKNVRSDMVGRDQTAQIGNNHDLEVELDSTLYVEGNLEQQVGSNEKTLIGGQHDRAVNGNETITIGGSRLLKMSRSRALIVERNRDLSVGSAMVDATLGSVSTESTDMFTTIGGLQAQLSLGTIADECGGLGVQTIGAAKLEFAAKNRMVDVDNIYLETIGGLLFCRSDDVYTDGSTNMTNWVVGGAMKSTAPELMVEAIDQITLVCGSSSVTLTPDDITFMADQLTLSDSAVIDTDTKRVDRN